MVIHPKFMTCCWVGEVWDHFPIIMFYWPFFLWFLTQMWLGFPLYRTSDVLTASFYPVYWVLLGLPGGGGQGFRTRLAPPLQQQRARSILLLPSPSSIIVLRILYLWLSLPRFSLERLPDIGRLVSSCRCFRPRLAESTRFPSLMNNIFHPADIPSVA